jgi:hypothetical protein
MGIEKRGLIFPRSSVTNREYGTRPDMPDPKFANPLRRPFSIEFRIGSGATFADRALKPMIPVWFWFKLPSTDQQAKIKRTARPPASLQSRPAGTILPAAASATFRNLIAFFG